MACVHFGVAATIKDCDVLCNVANSDDFRELIAATELRGLLPTYREGRRHSSHPSTAEQPGTHQ